jgi:hypothetical protein
VVSRYILRQARSFEHLSQNVVNLGALFGRQLAYAMFQTFESCALSCPPPLCPLMGTKRRLENVRFSAACWAKRT